MWYNLQYEFANKIGGIIQQPEGRKPEFKETLPTAADIARTIVAFANDAGGELFIGTRMSQEKLWVSLKTRS
jgi:predicted HTH transcriptional regulator